MPTRVKSPIRPRQARFRFTNAEILLLDTTGILQLIPASGQNAGLYLNSVEIQTKIAVNYGNIDVAANMFFASDFSPGCGVVENDAVRALTSFTDMFTQTFVGGEINLSAITGESMKADAHNTFLVVLNEPVGWLSVADIAANGGIFFFFDNGGADLNGGDPANFMDITLTYSLIGLEGA